MSEEKNTSEIPKTKLPAGLSVETLLQMLIQTQTQLAESQKQVADAILESRKPYVDPAVLEAKRQALEERRKQIQLELFQKQETKRQCPHTRVNSDSEGNTSFSEIPNIKWMEHSNGIILGVCGTCFSTFDSRNPKDRAFLAKDGKAIRNMGRARAADRSKQF